MRVAPRGTSFCKYAVAGVEMCGAAEGSNKAKINHLTDFTHPSAPPFPVSLLAASASRVSDKTVCFPSASR